MAMADITPQGVAKGFGLFVGVLFFLYWFLVGLSLLGDGFKIIAGDSAGTLFSAVSNPVAGLMVGILATVLVQSSSTTTSIIVAAAGSGVLDVATGIPMVFGANIGTSVTNTIVSLGFVGDKEQYRRGFAGATVHDMFNYMNVCLWLPLEAISSAINGGNGGVMFLITEAITRSFSPCVEEESPTGCEDWDGPLGIITDEIVERIVKVDSGVIRDFSYGRPELWHCQDLLCSEGSCEPYSFNQGRCTTSPLASAGICGEEGVEDDDSAEFSYCYYNGTTVATYDDIMLAAQEHFDGWKIVEGGALGDAGMQQSAGWVSLILSLVMLIVSLLAMVKLLGIAIRGAAEEVLQKALNMNGYLAILVGCGVTMFVQSSSITTSTLTPLVAMGTLTLEGMLPLTLGANLGTTLTGILASLVGTSVNGFQIAMAHVLFNVFGVVMFYPIPKIRQIPIGAARRLGDLAALFKAFPIFYIFMLFLVYPGFFLGVSIGITMGGGGLAGGVIGLLFFVIAHVGVFFWYWRKGGREFLGEKFGRTDEDGKVDSAVNPLAV